MHNHHKNKRFINTRPVQNNAILSQTIRQYDIDVLELPLLQLIALPHSEQLKQQFVQLYNADIIVVVSPIAVDIGMQYSRYYWGEHYLSVLTTKRWVAVGKATQRKLSQYGIESITPHLETSEGMLDLAIFQQHHTATLPLEPHQCVAIWRGIGGRTFLMQKLEQQGYSILNILLYRREQPRYSITQQQQLWQYLPAHVLISSEQSWRYWCDVLNMQFADRKIDKQILLWQNHYLVLGERVSKMIFQDFSHQKALFEKNLKVNLYLDTLSSLSAEEIVEKIEYCE